MGHGGSAKEGKKASMNNRNKSLGVVKKPMKSVGPTLKNQKNPMKSVGATTTPNIQKWPMKSTRTTTTTNPNNQKKPRSATLKNQIRSTERMLKKNLPAEVKEALEKKLKDLKNEIDRQACLAIELKISKRNKKRHFLEGIKIGRSIKRLEKLQLTSTDPTQEADIKDQLAKLKEDLEYVKFFPKPEEYVSLFIGGDDANVVEKRNKWRQQIKANIIDAAANGKDLEGQDLEGDDFFMNGSSSDEDDAADECIDKNTSERAPSAFGKAASSISKEKVPTSLRGSGKAASGIPKRKASTPASVKPAYQPSFSDKKQKHKAAEAVISPPWSSNNSFRDSKHQSQVIHPRVGFSSVKKPFKERIPLSSSFNKSDSKIPSSSRNREYSDAGAGHNNQSSNSEVHKPKRKRRPKKKKQQV